MIIYCGGPQKAPSGRLFPYDYIAEYDALRPSLVIVTPDHTISFLCARLPIYKRRECPRGRRPVKPFCDAQPKYFDFMLDKVEPRFKLIFYYNNYYYRKS